MHRPFLAVLPLFALIIDTGVARAAGETPRRPATVMVMPLENRTASADAWLSFGLPAVLAERLEGDQSVTPINGPYVLIAEQVQLVSLNGTNFDLAAANRLARSRGATHFTAGRYEGKAWEWTFTVLVYAALPSGPKLVGTGDVQGDMTQLVPARRGRVVAAPSIASVHRAFAMAASRAFANAGITLAPATVASLEIPSTQDHYAFLLLSRAYGRRFQPSSAKSADTALDIVERAVRVDPGQPEAQRFYAQMLREAGRERAARVHFEQALALRPGDFRCLLELGELEIAAGNPGVARGYLERAATARPNDPEPRFLLGNAFLAIGDQAEAIDAFERARILDDGHADARRELATLYSFKGRYADAARELARVVANMPADKDAAFLLAACLRADGKREEAILALAEGATRFPEESRFRSFRGDLLAEDGAEDEALLEYEAARRLEPHDLRVAAILSSPETPSSLLGGRTLLEAIKEGAARAKQMESTRETYMLAINDAILELRLRGKDACGAGASSEKLARHEGDGYWELGRELDPAAEAIRKARIDGEWSALTPDEERDAEAVIAAMAITKSDLREMRSALEASLAPLFREQGCDTPDDGVAMADPNEVAKRNVGRKVTLPEPPASTYASPISPAVSVDVPRMITFRVSNAGETTHVLTVSGETLGEIEPGRKDVPFSTSPGPHRYCLVPRGVACGAGTERLAFFSERFSLRMDNLGSTAY